MPVLDQIETPNARVFLARDDSEQIDYAYGGTRLVPADMNAAHVSSMLERLMRDESAIKNRLINLAIHDGALAEFGGELPSAFLESRVGGGRCVIQPYNASTHDTLQDPSRADFHETIAPIFERIGEYLNHRDGRLKLTPDFGRYAGLADMLLEHTPHVLGVRCEVGGCGGKSSYSATGVIEAFETLDCAQQTAVTLIGAEGALGSDVARYLNKQHIVFAASDVAYNDAPGAKNAQGASSAVRILPARWGQFTDACLKRGGAIVATTVGEELEHSNWQIIAEGTTLLMAHNLAVPEGDAGLKLTDALSRRGVLVIPGQLLTLGGALTSRLEWFWRQHCADKPFDKALAHEVVRKTTQYLLHQTLRGEATPYRSMLALIGE